MKFIKLTRVELKDNIWVPTKSVYVNLDLVFSMEVLEVHTGDGNVSMLMSAVEGVYEHVLEYPKEIGALVTEYTDTKNSWLPREKY